MVKIIHKEGEFLVKGTFSFGIAGVYENVEYGDSPIGLLYMSLNDLLRAMEKEKDFMLGELLPKLKQTGGNADKMAEVLTDYYNEQEELIKQNEKQINNYFFMRLFEEFVDADAPFWEVKKAILPEYRDKYSEEEYEELCMKYTEEIDEMATEYLKTPNDGSMEKTDVLPRLREMFPMFNFDGLIKTIKPECVTFHGRFISVQFSDSWGCELFCSAYEEFDEKLTPGDWHNF